MKILRLPPPLPVRPENYPSTVLNHFVLEVRGDDQGLVLPEMDHGFRHGPQFPIHGFRSGGIQANVDQPFYLVVLSYYEIGLGPSPPVVYFAVPPSEVEIDQVFE